MAQEQPLARWSVIAGMLLCLLGVLIGAFGAHMLDDLLRANQRLETFELANRYQMYHGLALIAIGGWLGRAQGSVNSYCVLCLFFGVLVFSGSLYVLAVTGINWLGVITPLGGLLLLCGWIAALWGVFRRSG